MMLTEKEVMGLLAARKLGWEATTAGVEGAIGKLERVLPLALRETIRAAEEASVLDLRAGSGETDSRVVMTLSDAGSRRQHRC